MRSLINVTYKHKTDYYLGWTWEAAIVASFKILYIYWSKLTSALKKAQCSPGMVIRTYQTTRRHVPEGSNIQAPPWENQISHDRVHDKNVPALILESTKKKFQDNRSEIWIRTLSTQITIIMTSDSSLYLKNCYVLRSILYSVCQIQLE